MSIEQLHVSLLQIDGDMLVVPNAAVMEVLPLDQLQPARGQIAPIWLAGWCQFEGARVPVLRFEVLNGGAVPAYSRRARIVMLDGGGFPVALLVLGYPHLVSLNRLAIEPLGLRDSDRAERLLGRARIARHDVGIPDLDALRAEAHAVSGGASLSAATTE